MRKKTEIRREAIIAAAVQEFSEHGYDGTSISAIVNRIGGSKQTIYSYFSTKNDLFVEAVLRIIAQHDAAIYAKIPENADIAMSLQKYGEYFMKVRVSKDMINLARLVYAEAGRTDTGGLLFEFGIMKSVNRLAAFLKTAMEKGMLRKADPEIAAIHFNALLDAELFLPIFLRVREQASDEEIAGAVTRAVNTFLEGFGPSKRQQP